MLGYHTKQVTSYGKRNQRIINVAEDRLPKQPVNIFDDFPPTQWAPIASKMKKRENAPQAKKSMSPKILHMHRKKRLSPVIMPLSKKRKTFPQIRRLEDEGESVLTPSRRPLGALPLNTPGSPAVLGKARLVSGRGTPLKKPFTPFVDIMVLDDKGRTVSQERRISGPIDSDSEDDSPPQPKPPRRLRRLATTRVDSGESDSDEDEPPVVDVHISSGPLPIPDSPGNVLRAPAKGKLPRLQLEVVLPLRRPAAVVVPPTTQSPVVVPPPTISPPAANDIPNQPDPPLRYQHFASPIPRARQLTPIGGRGKRLYAPPSPPSPLTPTDGDLTIDISDLSISLSPQAGRSSLADEIPDYLRPLLAECGQDKIGLHEFSAFIKTFPLDPLVSRYERTALGFWKIGEASYSEVFGIGDVVLKVIPLRDETHRRLRPNSKGDEADGPAPTDAKDVLKEIIVTHAMGEVCDGFVKLLRTYVVRGTYPQVLLELWDEYYQRKGSEGVRPDTFTVSQAYAIIVLPNGGPDLEAYTFKNAKTGWKQACSIFWQVAKALAHAEQLVSFEHRDLHLGQILVKEIPSASRPLQALSQNRKSSKSQRPTMDDPTHGVRATLIDLGLSRMDAGDGCGGEMVHWTPFEEEIFMGEGDYQFDIYRFMRALNGNNWEAFNPLTNAMWLHYLTGKLLRAKGLKAPARRKSQAPAALGSAFTERDCYECLVDLEEWLGNSVAAVVSESNASKAKGRKKKAQAVLPTPAALLLGPLCAGEVVGYGVKKGWVKSLA